MTRHDVAGLATERLISRKRQSQVDQRENPL
jgi:hypothetical protein